MEASNRTETVSRRQILAASAAALASTMVMGQTREASSTTQAAEPIIDIHQHTTYHNRTDEAMLHHQRKMGVTQTILLPSGSPVDAPSTLKGKANGLYAGAGGIETVVPVVKAHPGEYFFFANEVPDLPDAKKNIEAGLARGALGIGESKFNLPVDSKEMEAIYDIAREHKVPVLMHFQFETFNTGFERFGKMLEKYHDVTFIGHAQTFWANIDKNHPDQKVLYPRGKVTPGGYTDRYLTDYKNLYGDLSAGSGLNSLTRDEEHARGFLERHADQLMFGSDCSDPAGFGPTCSGAQCISAIRRLAPSKSIERKILYENAKQLFRI